MLYAWSNKAHLLIKTEITLFLLTMRVGGIHSKKNCAKRGSFFVLYRENPMVSIELLVLLTPWGTLFGSLNRILEPLKGGFDSMGSPYRTLKNPFSTLFS